MLLITLLSLSVALTSALVAWRVIRRERLRADARVFALGTAIDATPAADAFDWPEADDQTPAQVQAVPLFNEAAPRAGLRGRPLLTVGAGLAVALAIVVLIAMTGDTHDASTQTAAVRPPEALELISMRYARDGTTLAVTGLVRNRLEGPSEALTAVVSGLDRNGQIVGSGTTGLAPLAPGDESIFVVTIPRANDVARYRVTFRGTTGVVRHIDRRSSRATDVS